MHKSNSLSRGSSILLDGLRLCAAIIVVIVHAHDKWFPDRFYSAIKPGDISHSAVIIFFVLSGYVIAYTTISNNRGGRHYAQARLSRLYSILIPSLLITALIEILVWYFNPIFHEAYSRGVSFPRYFISLFFFNEIWFFSAAPPINSPLWSLSYEFWYYVIFGLWFYSKGGKYSILIPLAGCIIAGPKILLLMPVWLSGCLAYYIKKPKFDRKLIWVFVFSGLLLVVAAVIFFPTLPFGIGKPPFYFANQFLKDWVVAIFIAGALWILPLEKERSRKNIFSDSLRKCADLTFSIYILHYPLLIGWGALFGYRLHDSLQLFQGIATALIFSALLGIFFEKKRPIWILMIKKFLDRIKIVQQKMLTHLSYQSKNITP